MNATTKPTRPPSDQEIALDVAEALRRGSNGSAPMSGDEQRQDLRRADREEQERLLAQAEKRGRDRFGNLVARKPPEPADEFARIEQDAEARLVELDEQEKRMAPEALVDPRVAQELADVRSEKESAQRAIGQARVDRRDERRQLEQAEAKRLQAAIERVAKVRSERDAAASKADAALAQAIKACVTFAGKQEEVDLAEVDAGERQYGRGGSESGALVLAAVSFYMGEQGLTVHRKGHTLPDRPLASR